MQRFGPLENTLRFAQLNCHILCLEDNRILLFAACLGADKQSLSVSFPPCALRAPGLWCSQLLMLL